MGKLLGKDLYTSRIYASVYASGLFRLSAKRIQLCECTSYKNLQRETRARVTSLTRDFFALPVLWQVIVD